MAKKLNRNMWSEYETQHLLNSLKNRENKSIHAVTLEVARKLGRSRIACYNKSVKLRESIRTGKATPMHSSLQSYSPSDKPSNAIYINIKGIEVLDNCKRLKIIY